MKKILFYTEREARTYAKRIGLTGLSKTTVDAETCDFEGIAGVMLEQPTGEICAFEAYDGDEEYRLGYWQSEDMFRVHEGCDEAYEMLEENGVDLEVRRDGKVYVDEETKEKIENLLEANMPYADIVIDVVEW